MTKYRPLALAALALAARHAGAGPADYVFTPTVTKGERELDFKYGAASKTGEPSLQAASLGLGYGATEWWFTEFYAIGEREGASSRFDAFEWENKFQLTETGRYPVDAGSRPSSSAPRVSATSVAGTISARRANRSIGSVPPCSASGISGARTRSC
jgi:hypothetical protein